MPRVSHITTAAAHSGPRQEGRRVPDLKGTDIEWTYHWVHPTSGRIDAEKSVVRGADEDGNLVTITGKLADVLTTVYKAIELERGTGKATIRISVVADESDEVEA